MKKIIKLTSILSIMLFLQSCSHNSYEAVIYKNVSNNKLAVISGSVKTFDSLVIPSSVITMISKEHVFQVQTDNDGKFKTSTDQKKFRAYSVYVGSKISKTRRFRLKKGDSLVLNFYLDEKIEYFENKN